MIEISVNRDSDPVLVTVRGNLTFNTVEDLHRELMEAMPSAGALRLVLEEVRDFDLSGVQLLYALCRSGAAGPVTTEILPGEAAVRFEKMLRFAGLAPLSCGQS